MILSKSRRQHHKNGVRISKWLYDNIMMHAQARREAERQNSKCKNGREVHYITGMTDYVFGKHDNPSAYNWAEAYLSAGLIEDIGDFKLSWID